MHSSLVVAAAPDRASGAGPLVVRRRGVDLRDCAPGRRGIELGALLAAALRRQGDRRRRADRRRSRRKPWLPDGIVAEVVHVTLHELPDDGSTHWSTRTMAKRFGISKDSVARIWRDHELRPWKVEAFKISNDPHFEEKLVDVVGLYLNLPERAIVFSFDERTQCQALDRTQPSLPLKRGPRWHDDTRLQAQRHDRPLRSAQRRHR